MKKLFLTTGVIATTAALTACVPEEKSQKELAEYCGIDVQKLTSDLRKENPNITTVEILDTNCQTRVHFVNDGQQQYRDMDNDFLMGMLTAASIAAIASYTMGNHSQSYYRNQYNVPRNYTRSYKSTPYTTTKSRAMGAFSSGKKASGINVSSTSGKVTTRSKPFKAKSKSSSSFSSKSSKTSTGNRSLRSKSSSSSMRSTRSSSFRSTSSFSRSSFSS